MAKVQLAVERLSTVVTSLDNTSKNVTLALLFSHKLHLLELAFQGILDERGNFKDAIHQIGQGRLSPYFIPPEKLTSLLQDL